MSSNHMGEILGRVSINAVWTALGGAPPRHGRAPAFWRAKADGYNVALDEEKSVYFDHARGEGGGILDLVEHVKGCDRQAALHWLADFSGVPLDDRPLSGAGRRAWARARRDALPLARRAWWWWAERLAELEERKAAAVSDNSVEVERLAWAASEHHRLQGLSADGIVAAYLAASRADPEGAQRLVDLGCAWENAGRALVVAYLRRLTETEENYGAKCA